MRSATSARLRPAGFGAAAFAHGLPSRSAARREGWWEAEGIEPPAAKGLRLRRSDGTSRPYGRFPNLGGELRVRTPVLADPSAFETDCRPLQRRSPYWCI